jgi:N-acetylneuraminic acid mutarotase
MKKIYTFLSLLFITGYAVAQGTWTAKTPLAGSNRYRATSFVINGKCYVGTGNIGSTNNLQDLWEYDPAMNIWTQKADLTGQPRALATGCSDGTYGYIGLGKNNSVVLNDWWQYDPTMNTWTQKTSFPATTRYGAGAFCISGRVYVGGGIDSANSVHSDFYVYEPTGDTWTARHALTYPSCEMAVYVINNKGYFVGGAINGGVTGSSQNIEYDAVLDTWTSRTDFTGGDIYSCVGFAIDGIGYVGTGFIGNLTDVLYSWNPVTDTWTQDTDFPSGIRQFAVCCNVNNRAFIGTGNSTGGALYGDWWEFNALSTGISKPDYVFPQVYFDNSSDRIEVKNAMGTEIFNVMSLDGKVVLSGKLERGNNEMHIETSGIYLVRIMNGSTEKVVKIVKAE